MLKKATKRRLRDHWGYYGLLVTLVLLLTMFQQPTRFALFAIIVLGVIDVLFFLFQARMPCGVKNRRDGFCRNRGHGFLGGCTQVEGHRWIKLTTLSAVFTKKPYVASVRGITSRLSGKAATVSSGATVVMMLVAVLTFVIGPAGPR